MDFSNTVLDNYTYLLKHSTNEHETRRLLIEPLLFLVGYKVWECEAENKIVEEIGIEGASQTGGKGKCDYILYSNNKPYIGLETKAFNQVLTDNDAKQLCDYCVYQNPRLQCGVLTNGNEWRVYDIDESGSPVNKMVLSWKLSSDERKLVILIGPNDKMKTFIDELKTLPQNNDKIRNRFIEGEIKDLQDIFIENKLAFDEADEVVSIPVNNYEIGVDVMIIDNTKYQIKNSYEILINTAEWLIKQGKLTTQIKPIESGSKRYIINSRPVHIDGKTSFFMPKQISNGLYVEVHASRSRIIALSRQLLTHFGYSENILKVEF